MEDKTCWKQSLAGFPNVILQAHIVTAGFFLIPCQLFIIHQQAFTDHMSINKPVDKLDTVN